MALCSWQGVVDDSPRISSDKYESGLDIICQKYLTLRYSLQKMTDLDTETRTFTKGLLSLDGPSQALDLNSLIHTHIHTHHAKLSTTGSKAQSIIMSKGHIQ
jgi:hypothetical protein